MPPCWRNSSPVTTTHPVLLVLSSNPHAGAPRPAAAAHRTPRLRPRCASVPWPAVRPGRDAHRLARPAHPVPGIAPSHRGPRTYHYATARELPAELLAAAGHRVLAAAF